MVVPHRGWGRSWRAAPQRPSKKGPPATRMTLFPTPDEGATMGFFSSKPRYEPSVRPTVSISGKVNFVPCEIGGANRRILLMASAIRTLANHPLAQPGMSGRPLGDGVGLESVVAELQVLFRKEQALVKWVALRGALLMLQLSYPPRDTTAAAAMGIDDSGSGPRLFQTEGLTDQQVQACVGLYASLRDKLMAYDELEHMSLDAVLDDPRFRNVNTAVGYDYIAWASVALLRSGRLDVIGNFGEPGRLDIAGWYTEPMFSKAERYFDGADWTNQCRAIENGREILRPSRLN
jgi:hypothetical protein